MKKVKKSRESQDLSQVLNRIKRKFGSEFMEDCSIGEVYSTGLPTLDEITGIGGLPSGRMVELFGPEGTGKSSLTMKLAATMQKLGKVVLWADFEHCFMSDYASRLGMDVSSEKLIQLKPLHAEEGFDAILRLVPTGEIGLVVIDSVAAAVPNAEIEPDGYSNTQVGLQSRVITAFVKKLIPTISRHNTLVVFINQLRSAISFNVHMPSTVTTPGGRALKFYASMRIQLQLGKAIQREVKDPLPGTPDKRAVAHIVHLAMAKNKLEVPFRRADILLVHGKGFREVPPKKIP